MNYCYQSTDELVEQLSVEFLDHISEKRESGIPVNIAISGGNTPKAFFERITINQQNQETSVTWDKVHFFWVDERCVPPHHGESNYRMAWLSFLKKIDCKKNNIHRIKGENNPDSEALRYSQEVKKLIPLKEGIPLFDMIFLGMGVDGHTASIFPNRFDLLDSDNIYEPTSHPVTGQLRITLTGRSILQAKRLIFLVTGEDKSEIVRKIMNHEAGSSLFPAAHIYYKRPDAEWYMDSAAARLLIPQNCEEHI